MKVYINKNYVLRKIKEKLDEVGSWKYFSIMIFEHPQAHTANNPESYEELVELLKDYECVYLFYQVDSAQHGELAYDIVLKEEA